MAETRRKFRGIQQVTEDYYNQLSAEDKKGVMFAVTKYVNDDDPNQGVERTYICLGNRQYANNEKGAEIYWEELTDNKTTAKLSRIRK